MTRADTGTRIGSEGTTPLDKVLSRVRKLIAVAEHPNTDPDEAARCRAGADALMLAYSIQEIKAESDRPASTWSKPSTMMIQTGGGYEGITGYLVSMADKVALHCHCRIRNYHQYDHEAHVWLSKVYGFESDLHFFEITYTTLRLHMLGALLPKVNPDESLDLNAYRLHNAGYNWLEIAEMYGWRKARSSQVWEWSEKNGKDPYSIKVPYWNKDTEEIQPATQVGSNIKRAYYREVKRCGEQPTQIPAGGSETFRASAAMGYVSQISRLLREAETGREAGAEVVLARRMDDLNDLFKSEDPKVTFVEREPCPRCAKNPSGTCRDHPAGRAYKPRPFSDAGYSAGVRHANTADLRGNKTTAGSRPAIG
jgi:Protein of unknown function (DUF2786)